jgi:hypothetical protein
VPRIVAQQRLVCNYSFDYFLIFFLCMPMAYSHFMAHEMLSNMEIQHTYLTIN